MSVPLGNSRKERKSRKGIIEVWYYYNLWGQDRVRGAKCRCRI